MDAAEICERLNLHNQEELVLNIYPYGSRVYGTASETSDHDFIIVCVDQVGSYSEQIQGNGIDGSVYPAWEFEKKILAHDPTALECLWLPAESVKRHRRDFLDSFILDLPTLRESFSSKSSNSFVKAKKKLTVEKDHNPYIAKKSLFHSLRILKYGIQIAASGQIHDYRAANTIWESIRDYPSEDWEDYKTTYQPLYNELKTAFRELAPKA